MAVPHTRRAALRLVAVLAASGPLCAQIFLGELDTTGVSDTFSKLYPARAKSFVKGSSDPDERPTAPQRGNDDGFTGLNAVESYRYPTGNGDVAVLADVRGRAGFMGLFFRNYWSGLVGQPVQPEEMNRTQIVVDGVVVHDMPLPDYHRSIGDVRGQVPPFSGPFTANRAGGHVTHTPISWQDEFRVDVFENTFDNAARFHRVGGMLAPPEGGLVAPDLQEWNRVAGLAGSWPHKSARVPFQRRLAIPADGGVRVVRLYGPDTILELTAKVGRPEDFDDLWLRITWDDLPRASVDVPLRFLGGFMRRPFAQAISSLLFHNNGVDTITSYWPMHFRSKARLEFWNHGAQDIVLDLTHATAYGVHPEPWGYFTALHHRRVTRTGETFRGPLIDGARGVLRCIMLEDSANTRMVNADLLHLEGDLCVRINGNRGDDHTFEASETSIGKWGWYGSPSDVPFSSDGAFNTGLLTRTRPDMALETNRLMGSTFVFEPICFASGIDIVLEHGIQNLSNADYALVTLYYVQPGAAREQVLEIDVGDTASEGNALVQFGSAPSFHLLSNFFRDQFFGTPPINDDGRRIDDWYRFTVQVPGQQSYRGFCVAFRLDRERVGDGGIAQADLFVDGRPAGLLHSATSNELNRWKEGGELEVELPRALTDGRSSFVVDVRPRAGTLPIRAGAIKVYGYTRD